MRAEGYCFEHTRYQLSHSISFLQARDTEKVTTSEMAPATMPEPLVLNRRYPKPDWIAETDSEGKPVQCPKSSISIRYSDPQF